MTARDSRLWPRGSQERDHLLCGSSAMADSVFLFSVQLCQVARFSLNPKHGIKAEPSTAALIEAYRAFAYPFKHALLAIGRNNHDHGTKASRASAFRYILQRAK